MGCRCVHTSSALLLLPAVLVYILSSSPVLADGVATNVTFESVNYLQRFGYLSQPDPRSGKLLEESSIQEALIRLQRFAGISETGMLDENTIKLLETPRCGMPDFGTSDNARRKKRYTHQGTQWNKRVLTWRVSRFTPDLPQEVVIKTLREAFKKWSDITNLDFVEVGSGNREVDMDIKFAVKYHDDSFPFDGPGGTLAHGFYPANNLGLSGDIHFDDDEYFTRQDSRGKDLLWVAVHEIGHAIGLEHSNVKDAIMFPWYPSSKTTIDVSLTDDDIQGIQGLYGERPGQEPVTTSNPRIIPTASNRPAPRTTCPTTITAAWVNPDQRTVVISSDQVFILAPNLGIERGPIELSRYLPGATGVDSAYLRPDGRIVVFSGRRFNVYDNRGNRVVIDGDIQQTYRLPSSIDKIDASFVWPSNNRLYLFRQHLYWRYDHIREKMDLGYPRNISSAWANIPANLDEAIPWGLGKTFFFKGSQFWRLDHKTLKADPGFPKDISSEWMKCTPSPQNIGSSSSALVPCSALLLFLGALLWSYSLSHF